MSPAPVLVVVAAGPGLGATTARRFAREGWSVGLVARSAGTLDRVATEVRQVAEVQVATATADVSDEDALRRALRSLEGQIGAPTVVVYNGSAYVEGSPLTLQAADLRHAVAVGVTGALVAAQETAGSLRARAVLGEPATLILTGSVAADRGSTTAAAVGVAKAGLRSLGLSLHKELAPAGVRVVSVTVRGALSGPRALDLDQLAEAYWQLVQAERDPGAVVNHPPG